MKKRKFLKSIGAASTLLLTDPYEALGQTVFMPIITKKTALVLGGRGFIGPSIVQSLLANGYEVTLLNRNRTNTHLFKDLPLIICDREKEDKAGLKSIDSKYRKAHWDVVVDTWQKSPKAVSDFLEMFKVNIGHFHYISTISVYDNWNKKYIEENEPLNPLPSFPKTIAEGNVFRYAIRKTFAEKAVRATIENYTIYRSSGMKDYRVTRPEDPDAQPFWPVRFSRGGEILLPRIEGHHIQFSDVQSLINFIVHCSANQVYGEYNVASYPTPFKDYISGLIYATGMPDKLHWIDGEFLKKQGLQPYKIVPFWREVPVGVYSFNVQKAVNAGFVHRPIVDMVSDQLAGYKSRFPNDDVRFGEAFGDRTIKYYSMEKEKEVIKKWLNR